MLYRRIPKKIVTNLNPDENHSQFRRDQTLKDGLQQAKDFFRNTFAITARGLSRPYWKDDSKTISEPPVDLELPIQKDDFFDCAKKLEGSRDVGAQLFCALLRSCGVDARLACSLQVLPLTTASKGTTQKKSERRIIPVINHNPPTSEEEHISDSLSDRHSSSQPLRRPIGSTGGLTRFASPNSTPSKPKPRTKPPRRPRRLIESPFPVFWVEVFNSASQKWTPVDPLVTNTINKPHALCPPSSDAQNALTVSPSH